MSELVGTNQQTQACEACCGSGSIEKPHPSGWEEWGTIYGECPMCKGRGWTLIEAKS